MKIAKRLLNEWSIGDFNRFCDESSDFDAASEEAIAEVIREVIAGV